jgi:hypothetical protein
MKRFLMASVCGLVSLMLFQSTTLAQRRGGQPSRPRAQPYSRQPATVYSRQPYRPAQSMPASSCPTSVQAAASFSSARPSQACNSMPSSSPAPRKSQPGQSSPSSSQQTPLAGNSMNSRNAAPLGPTADSQSAVGAISPPAQTGPRDPASSPAQTFMSAAPASAPPAMNAAPGDAFRTLPKRRQFGQRWA